MRDRYGLARQSRQSIAKCKLVRRQWFSFLAAAHLRNAFRSKANHEFLQSFVETEGKQNITEDINRVLKSTCQHNNVCPHST